MSGDNGPSPEQLALYRSLAAVCNQQSQGMLVAEVAQVLGWLTGSAAKSHCENNPRYERQMLLTVAAYARATLEHGQVLEDKRH